MMTTKNKPIDIDIFIQYKALNHDVLPVLVGYCNSKQKATRPHTNWKKMEPKAPTNWLLTAKLNQTDNEKLYSQIRSILNKVSETNFNGLAKELMTLEITSPEHLAKLTELLFNKALIEPKFSNTYAKLAKELYNFRITENDNAFYFRESLINRCQRMFNDCISLDQEPIVVTKETSVGCMTFIGELYLCDLLTNKIINSCFLLLLMKITSTCVADCIVALMKVVNEKFANHCPNEMAIILNKIKDIITSNTLSNKDKFRLMDIIDIKKNIRV